jgi:chaperonin GroES
VQVGDKTLLVVGDRVLVRPEDGESTTNTGLILPPSVGDREEVQTGRVVTVGPGTAILPSTLDFEEGWKKGRTEPRHVAMQARTGDIAVYYRKAAVDITIDGEKLVVVSHAAILVLLREGFEVDDETSRVN